MSAQKPQEDQSENDELQALDRLLRVAELLVILMTHDEYHTSRLSTGKLDKSPSNTDTD